LDGLIRCGMNRLQKQLSAPSLPSKEADRLSSLPEVRQQQRGSSTGTTRIPYANIHECSASWYDRCANDNTTEGTQCRDNIDAASILSYCAPLKDLGKFRWLNSPEQDEKKHEPAKQASSSSPPPFSAVTVMRHPVHRVWSMFRFQTKGCYRCMPLKDVYAMIDAGTFVNRTADAARTKSVQMCADQLQNHQTRNLLTSDVDIETTPEDELVRLAVRDLDEFFTVVGITEDMDNTHKVIGHVFPWLAETTTTDPDPKSAGADSASSTTCAMPHANASPRNNGCGPGGTHWDLPDHPDEETERLIIQHNQLDMQVYDASLRIFDMQKQVLGLQ